MYIYTNSLVTQSKSNMEIKKKLENLIHQIGDLIENPMLTNYQLTLLKTATLFVNQALEIELIINEPNSQQNIFESKSKLENVIEEETKKIKLQKKKEQELYDKLFINLEKLDEQLEKSKKKTNNKLLELESKLELEESKLIEILKNLRKNNKN